MKIIVVDDEPLVKQYIVQCVRDAGGENEITAAVTSGAKGAAGDEGKPCRCGICRYHHAQNGRH